MIALSTISIVLPFRNDATGTRLEAMRAVLRNIHEFCEDIDIHVIEQDTDIKFPKELITAQVRYTFFYNAGLFNLARARNIGLKLSTRPYVWMHDADVLNTPNTYLTVSKYNGISIVRPYMRSKDIDRSVTLAKSPMQHVRNDAAIHQRIATPVDRGCFAMQAIIPKSALPYIGYLDERCQGWGFEDGEYALRIMKLGYPIAYMDAECYHIEHVLPHGATARGPDRKCLIGSVEADAAYARNYKIYKETADSDAESLRKRHGLLNLNASHEIRCTAPLRQHMFDEPLCLSIARLFKKYNITSCLDIGCGDGSYTKTLRYLGINCVGLDSASDTVLRTNGAGFIGDLRVPIPKQLRQEAVLSLEVGEHVDKKYEPQIFRNLWDMASKVIIVSWAIPGQGGEGHVNCLPNEYVIKKMQELGARFDEATSQALRQVSTLPWFKNTIMVFHK